MVDFKHINGTEYKYIFEIDNIKRALFQIKKSCLLIMKCSFLEMKIKRRIIKFEKDFKIICFRIIKKEIETIDDYINAVSALVSINAKIERTLRKIKDKKHKREITKIYYSFKKVDKFIPFATGRFEIFVNNHSTSIGIFLIILLITIVFTVYFFSQNTVIALLAALLMILFMIFYLAFENRIENGLLINKIDRNIYKNTYAYRVNKKSTIEDLDLILKVLRMNNLK